MTLHALTAALLSCDCRMLHDCAYESALRCASKALGHA